MSLSLREPTDVGGVGAPKAIPRHRFRSVHRDCAATPLLHRLMEVGSSLAMFVGMGGDNAPSL